MGKKTIFKNIMVTLGCTAFASVYAIGGKYVVTSLLGGENGTKPAWLERVEIRVDDRASGNTVAGSMVAETAGAAGSPENLDSGVSNSGGSDRSDSGDTLQKPRFEEREEETETEMESESDVGGTEADRGQSGEKGDADGTDKKSGSSLDKTDKTDGSEKDSDKKDSDKKDSDEKDSDKKDSDEKDSDEKDFDKKDSDENDPDKDKKSRDAVRVSHVQVIDQEDQALAVMADVTAVVKTAMPCVVSITNEFTAYDYWYDEEYNEQANGSGIIVAQSDEELLIVTNYHVVEDNNSLYVQFTDDAEAYAYVKGTSPENDLAIVSVFLEDMSDDTLESIAIAALGDSDSLQVGEPAIAIGDSLGYGQSVTTGVISALNRNLFADDPSKTPEYLIQTDAAINPGNSGGALLNVRGEVVGINSSKIADYVIEGMGYAIPISTAKPIIEDLMQKETRRKVPQEERAFLGIAGTDVIEEATARYEMPEGVYVSNVLEDTAADEAGILKGDIIMYIDGERITHMEGLQGLLEYYAAGTEVEVVVMRQSNGEYKERTVKVVLGYQE
jgi:S1-C subfamily serine protease